MSSLHQMGHHTKNLIFELDEGLYSGAILSPVNDDEEKTQRIISECSKIKNFNLIFDPQLYFPRTERECLKNWSYFPKNFHSVDRGSISFWKKTNKALLNSCYSIKADAVCSPVTFPKKFNNDFYNTTVDIANNLISENEHDGLEVIQSVIVDLSDISTRGRSLELASIISKTEATTILIMFYCDIEPRRELSDSESLSGAMRLVNLLEQAGLTVIVGFSSTDMVLWKAAEASICSTGKFFNLRRFTKSRFDEPKEGGAQIPYWFEESLLSFLRAPDIKRLQRIGFIDPKTRINPYEHQILEIINKATDIPWLALSWRQYMYAFSDLEKRIDQGKVSVEKLLRAAEKNWLYLEDTGILMEEPRNNGAWIRPWLIATKQFSNY